MATIENPSIRAYPDLRHINNMEFPALPLQADDDTVDQYCTEQGITKISYTSDSIRFSNDGARLYNYYNTERNEWLNVFGYSPIVTEITYS